MSFSENLQYLRKKYDLTQEQFAEEFGVSRQAVSKWETGEAFPETEKIMLMCDKFGVSMDALLRGNIIQIAEEDDAGYKKHMNVFSLLISCGVLLIMVGVSLCVLLGGVAETYGDKYAYIAGAVLLAFVAVAVFLFIYGGITNDNFNKAHSEIKNVFTQQEVQKFNKKFTIGIAVSVSVIILCVVALMVFFGVVGEEKLDSDPVLAGGFMAAFLFAIGICVSVLTFLGIRHSKYDVAGYNAERAGENAPSRKKKFGDALCGAIMLLATAVFLLLGFVWNLWHPGWVVFPVGGILCGIIGTFTNYKG